MAESNMVTIQSNLKRNDKDYNTFGYFLQGIDVTQQNLESFNPFLRGRGRIFMHTMPRFMYGAAGSSPSGRYDATFHHLTMRFKSYLETAYTQISGIQDVSVNFTEFEGGFNGQKFENVATVKDDTDTLTISLYEQSGSPVREFIETWVTGVRDPRSGIAHYHGEIDNGNAIYSEKNHTAEFIYYVLDPTGRQIEYACMFAHCFPRKIIKEHYNYEQGNMDAVLLDLEFSTTKYESVYINQIASWYNYIDRLNYKYLDFNPNKRSGTSLAEPAGNYPNEGLYEYDDAQKAMDKVTGMYKLKLPKVKEITPIEAYDGKQDNWHGMSYDGRIDPVGDYIGAHTNPTNNGTQGTLKPY